MLTPINPRPAISRRRSAGKSSLRSRSRAPGSTRSWAKVRAVWRTRSCVSLSSRSTALLHRLEIEGELDRVVLRVRGFREAHRSEDTHHALVEVLVLERRPLLLHHRAGDGASRRNHEVRHQAPLKLLVPGRQRLLVALLNLRLVRLHHLGDGVRGEGKLTHVRSGY